jgi:hypothetical protein
VGHWTRRLVLLLIRLSHVISSPAAYSSLTHGEFMTEILPQRRVFESSTLSSGVSLIGRKE